MKAATQPVLDRTSPAAVDAERSVLGAIMLSNFTFNEAAAVLHSEDFYLDSHRHLWRCMSDLADHGRPIDIISLSSELGRRKELDAIGGVAYISSLTDGVPRRASIADHLRIVREKAILRGIIVTSNNAAARALDHESPETILGDLQERIIELVHGENPGVSVEQAARETAQSMEAIRSSQAGCIGVPTGLSDLDELTTGFRAKELAIIAASTAGGKTALMCQSVRAAIKAAYRPGVISIEVDRMQIVIRLACMEGNLNVFDARDPRVLNPLRYNELLEAIAQVGQWPFFMEDGRMTIKRLNAIVRLWVSKGCDIIYVDYLGQLAASAPGKNEYERVTFTAGALWELARFVGVPVVALCQLKRIGREEPTLDDLRSSGEIEQKAHVVILAHRDRDEEGEFTGYDKVILAKQRSGPSGKYLPVRFNGPVGMYEPRR